MKAYPLVLEEITDDSGWECFGYYSKGVHAAEDFMPLIHNEIDGATERKMFHEWWRIVPVRYADEGTARTRWVDAKPHTRGAFPITAYHDL